MRFKKNKKNLVQRDMDKSKIDIIKSWGYNVVLSVVAYLRKTEDTEVENISKLIDCKLGEDPATDKYLPNLDKALKLFKDFSKKKHQHLLIVSDFDCDGISSAVMAYKSLSKIFKFGKNYKLSCLVNKRVNGTGYNKKLLQRIYDVNQSDPVDLIISFDHGSSDEKSFQELKSVMPNVKFILTDHHLPHLDNMPTSVDAYINPHIQGTTVEFANTSGCCVGFLTLLYVYKNLYNKPYKEALLDFEEVLPNVAISIISDVMPLNIPINRFFTKIGLRALNKFKNSLWFDLRQALGEAIEVTFTAKDISYKMAPIINVGNRANIEELIFQLLVEENKENRLQVLKEIMTVNEARKHVVNELTKDILSKVKPKDVESALCLYINSPMSLNGLVAAKIGQMFNVPSVCFNNSFYTETISGSLRGIVKDFNVMEVMDNISKTDDKILANYGGHTGAGGCSVYKERLPDFEKYFKKFSKIQLAQLPSIDTIYYDWSISLNKVDGTLVERLKTLEPYGKNWEEPVFYSKATVKSFIVQSKRFLFTFYAGNRYSSRTLPGHYYFTVDKEYLLHKLNYDNQKQFDIIFTVELSNYHPKGIQLSLKYISPARHDWRAANTYVDKEKK